MWHWVHFVLLLWSHEQESNFAKGSYCWMPVLPVVGAGTDHVPCQEWTCFSIGSLALDLLGQGSCCNSVSRLSRTYCAHWHHKRQIWQAPSCCHSAASCACIWVEVTCTVLITSAPRGTSFLFEHLRNVSSQLYLWKVWLGSAVQFDTIKLCLKSNWTLGIQLINLIKR